MKRLTSLVTASLVLAIGLTTARAQNTVYFDVNDQAPDSGVLGQVYNWNIDGSGAAPAFWNLDPGGVGAVTPLPSWVSNLDSAVFSAGSDANGQTYGVAIAAGIAAANIEVKNGTVQISSGLWDTGTGTTIVRPNASIKSIASGQFNGAGKLTLQGTSLADAGWLQGANPGTAGTMINNLKAIEIDGFGRVSYDDGVAASNLVNIINGSVITGVGGTPANGGAGTLVKSGPDQVGYAVRDTGGGVYNFTLNSFAKLVVQQDTFRLRNLTVGTVITIDERLFGAVPLAPLADAITLDGGGIGSNATVTLNANRGITVGPNGGYLDNGAGAGLIITGTVTVPAGNTLTIGSANSTSVAATRFEFSNTGNTTTFQGNLFMLKSTLRLNAGSNLNVQHFSGVGYTAAAWGSVEVSAATTLTAGLDNQDASFDGQIKNNLTTAGTGGIFKWDGTGTLTLNPNTSEWTNTGGVNINKGQIKYATTAAGFATLVPVTIGSTAKLNMNGVNDTFGSLNGPAGAVVDMKDAAAVAGNLTLGATTGTATYSGTIIGGGNLTMGSAASTATQVLAGNSTVGTVAVNFGTLQNNATMTTSGGVTVAAGATLGGTGIISGAITNNGIIAPGASVGTLSVTGNVTNAAGSSWSIELSGATADKLAVTGGIDLTAADTLNVTGAGTGTSWTIGTYSGSLTGVFDTITPGYTVSYTGGNITLNAAPVGLAGDFNSDGKVDAGDYGTWRKNEVANLPLANDGGAGNQAARFTLWRANFGNPPGAGSGGGLGSSNVPEPASLGLLVIGLATLGLGRRNRVA